MKVRDAIIVIIALAIAFACIGYVTGTPSSPVTAVRDGMVASANWLSH